MASSINASTSGAGGVITTADNSGILNLQSNGTTVATVSSTGFSTPANQTINTANTFGFKNRIINGGMVIDQRNGGASSTGSNVFTVDRFGWYTSQGSKFTWGQNLNSITPPTGFSNYLGYQSSSAYSVTSSDYFQLIHNIEGFNTADLAFGTANAKTITISFWVYSSLTGTFAGGIQNSAGNRAYPFTYTISSANTWTQISVTIAGDTTGTWVGATNATGISLRFSLGAGSNYQGTANTWNSSGAFSVSGATNIVGTNGATWYITGVQLEVGSQATSFDFRSIGQELALCQRYYETAVMGLMGSSFGGANWMTGWRFEVTKRTTPTMTNGSVITIWDPSTATYTQSSAGLQGAYTTTGGSSMIFNTFSGLTTYRPYISQAGSESTALTASAEL